MLRTVIKTAPVHYRFVDYHDDLGKATLHLEEWYVVRETPCTYLIVPSWSVAPDGTVRSSKPKRVTKQARKAHCYPCKDVAFHSFTVRKEWQIIHAKRNLYRAEKALHLEQSSVKSLVHVNDFSFLSKPN